MSIPITQSLQKRTKPATWFICFCLALLSVYPVYRNFYYSNGIKTYERHQAILEKRSEFYNPWQYRVLAPAMVEGMLWIYNNTVDKIFPIEEKLNFSIANTSGTNAETDEFVRLMQTPGAMKYMIIFIFFRFAEHFLIFYLAWRLWSYFTGNNYLIFFGICFLALSMGNAVTAADLSFNTYLDNIFYLLTALLILGKWKTFWLIPIIILAAFNRETSIMLPALYFISHADLSRFSFGRYNFGDIKLPGKSVWIITIVMYAIFFTIFFSLRNYFGYQPQQVWKAPAGWPMLKLNLVSAVGFKGYMELIGTLAVIPLIIIYKFYSFPYLLRKWFLFLVPVWFAVHYVSVVVYQGRLFLVPMIIVMIPMMLWLIDNAVQGKRSYSPLLHTDKP